MDRSDHFEAKGCLNVKKPLHTDMAENLLQLIDGEKSFGARTLFQNASVSVNQDEHIGVIGPNGAGKSTFFKILTSMESLDQGTIVRSRDLRMGYLSQHDNWRPGETGNQYLAEHALVPLWELKSRGRELKLSEELLDKPILSLSGGYRMRIKLLALLGNSPNLLLLDEPTNYLDLETTLLLERFLQNFDGAFLLISHDREFLRRTTDHTLEIDSGEFTKFNGHIDDYFEQKDLLGQQLQARAQSLADKRQSILDFVNRFGAKATKARQAQSRLRQLEKMEQIEIKPIRGGAVVKIPAPLPTGEVSLEIQQATLGYGERKILEGVQLRLLREDHVGVVGYNGAGKSTLLKALAGQLSPQVGRVQIGHEVKIAHFHQHVVESLSPGDSVFQSLQAAAHPSVGRQEILDMAGSLLFSGEEIEKRVSMLSGGECTRVALGRVLLQKSSCLILDEPTNHLDFQTVEALTQALEKFPGTVVTVSHDRGFIQRVAKKIIEIKNGRAQLYPGTYDEYVWHVQQELAADEDANNDESLSLKETDSAEPTVVKNSWSEKKEQEKRERQRQRRISEIESEIQDLSGEVAQLNESISSGGSADDLKAWVEELSQVSTRLNVLEEEWLSLSSD